MRLKSNSMLSELFRLYLHKNIKCCHEINIMSIDGLRKKRNPMHRIEQAHPGDTDYRRPNYPDPPAGTPDCPFGDRCYRRNPIHFHQFAHPPSTDPKKNYREHKRKLREKAKKKKEEDEYDLEDDFIDDEEEDLDFSSDEDDEYVPSDSDMDDTEEL